MNQNTFIYCSSVTVVPVHFDQKFTQIATILQTEQNQKVTHQTTDKHAADCSKSVCWGRKVICVICINCSYNNIAKGIRLLDKIAIFVYIGKIIQGRAFERSVSLTAYEFQVLQLTHISMYFGTLGVAKWT